MMSYYNQSTSAPIIPYYENKYVKLFSQIVGYVAEFSIVILNVPQIILICRKKSGKNVSITMIFFNIISGLLFLVYGILIYQWPMIIGNSLYLFISLVMLGSKYLYKNVKECQTYSPKRKMKDNV